MAKLPRGIHTEIEWLRLDFHVCMTWQFSHIRSCGTPGNRVSDTRFPIGVFSNLCLFLRCLTLTFTLPLVYLSIKPPSQIFLQISQSPPAPSVANLRLRGPRHHRPAPASVNAAHRQQNQVLFCLFRLDFSFSFRFS